MWYTKLAIPVSFLLHVKYTLSYHIDANTVTLSVKFFNPLKFYPVSRKHLHKVVSSSSSCVCFKLLFIYSRAFINNVISNGKSYRCNDTFTVWNFHSNWLLFLRVMRENKGGCFFLNTVYNAVTSISFEHLGLPRADMLIKISMDFLTESIISLDPVHIQRKYAPGYCILLARSY